MDKPVVVLDLETTGLSAYAHKITEIAAVKVHNGEILEKFHTLVNPQTPIPKFITTLTGINDNMVKDAPTISQVLPQLKEFLANHTIVAHNATFDYKFLQHNFLQHHNHRLTNQKLCTSKLATRLLDLPRKRLLDVCNHFNIENDQAHRAMSDTLATAKAFLCMTKILKEINITTIEQTLSFEQLTKAKALRLVQAQPILS